MPAPITENLRRSPSPASKPHPMAPDIQNIDPNGDVVLVLTRYVHFEDDGDSTNQVVDQIKLSSDSPTSKSFVPACQNKKENCSSTKKENQKTEHRLSTGSASTQSDFSDSFTTPPSSEEVIIRVSSRHLMLASPVFRAMLSQKFSESNALHMTGSVDIPLPDDDPDAFVILLNILHGRMRRVPLTIDLETFVQVAILVDKYDILEPVELLANFWFDALKSTIPESFTDDIPSWICICWVFDKPNEFLHATQLAMRYGKDDLAAAGLPIPSSVSNAINNLRTEALGKIISMLLEYVDDYLDKEHCSFECDALMLGSLTKRLRTLKLLPHTPDAPYPGLSFEDFNYRFRQGMYFPGAQRTSALYYGHSKCAIRSIDRMLAKCDEQLCGLKLEELRGPQ